MGGQRYKILDELGRGGMGVVYRALDSTLKREVALKMCIDEREDDPDLRARFRRELETIAQLSHPSLVRIYDSGESEGAPYYTMELLEGRDLSQIMREGPLDPLRAALLMAQAAEALAYLHARGFVHRDVKPANLFVDPRGGLKVMDFGLVRDINRTVLTVTRQTLGTIRFMPPEAFRPAYAADGARDVYALGLTFYEAIGGKRPFREGEIKDLLMDIAQVQPPPLTGFVERMPAALSDLIDRCCAKDPAKRPAAGEVARECARIRAARASGPRRAPSHGRGARVRAAVAMACGVALVLGAVAALMGRGREPRPVASVPAAPSVSAVAADRLAVDFLEWLPTHEGVLVDFDITNGGAIAVDVGAPEGPVEVPAGARAFRHLFGGLLPAHAYTLRITRPGFSRALCEIPFVTRPLEHLRNMTDALALLRHPRELDDVAIQSLLNEPDPAATGEVTAFLSRVRESSAPARERAARLLWRLRDPAAAQALASALPLDSGEGLPIWILRAAAASRSPRVAEMAEFMVHHDPPLEWLPVIFHALSYRQSDCAFAWLEKYATRADLPPYSGIACALIRSDPRRAPPLLRAMLRGTPDPRRLEAAAALEGAEGLRELVMLLGDRRPTPLRADAACELAGRATPEADAMLAKIPPRSPMEPDLMLAVARRGLPEGAPEFATGLERAAPPELKHACCLGAGMLASLDTTQARPFTPLLATQLTAPELAVRAAAAWALARSKDPAAAAALATAALSDVDADGRAALALAQRPDARPHVAALADLASRLSTHAASSELPRRARVAVALKLSGHATAVQRLAELAALAETDAPSRLARWIARQATPRPSREDPDTTVLWLDPALPLHPALVHVHSGEVLWLRAAGLWLRDGETHSLSDRLPEPREGTPLWISPYARIGQTFHHLDRSWEPLVMPSTGQLDLQLYNGPHGPAPGHTALALTNANDGAVCVMLRHNPPED